MSLFWCTCYSVKGEALGICQSGATHFTVCNTIGEGSEREQCCLFSSHPSSRHWQFLPLPQLAQGFASRSTEGLFLSALLPRLHDLSHSPAVPPGLSAHECGTTLSTSHHSHLAHPVCQPPSCCLYSVLAVPLSLSYQFR